jgi:thiamine kinase-like enzyme
VYVDILASAGLGTPSCFGVIDEHGAPRWLLLERVDLVELFQVGDLHRWESAARWAARLHRQFAGQADALVESAVPLLRHDRDWVDRWAARATRYAPTRDARVARLLALGPGLAEAYAGLPRTFVHGELYASNVLVGDAGTSRVCAVDWEMAAIAPGLVDLAALTAGRWSADARHKLEDAYCDELGRPRDAEFVEALQVCRLTACLQWLGWAQGWRAPTEHAHPWLDEAMELADLLGW